MFQDFYLKDKDGAGLPKKKTTALRKRVEEVLVLIASGKPGLKNTAQLVIYAITIS